MKTVFISIGLGLITLGFALGMLVTGYVLAGLWAIMAALAQVLFGWRRGLRIEKASEHIDTI